MITSNELEEIMAEFWEITFGWSLEPLVPGYAETDRLVCAQVSLSTGEWQGLVEIACAPALARRVAAALFDEAAEDLDDADDRDAVAEIANVVGGNVKVLLPENCELSLPRLVESPGARLGTVTAVVFTCAEEPLRASVCEVRTGQEAVPAGR